MPNCQSVFGFDDDAEDDVELVADVAAGLSAGVGADGRAGGVEEGVAGGGEVEVVIPEQELGPLAEVELQVDVRGNDVLAADDVHVAEILVAEGEELVEGAVAAGLGVLVAGGVVVSRTTARAGTGASANRRPKPTVAMPALRATRRRGVRLVWSAELIGGLAPPRASRPRRPCQRKPRVWT